MPHVSHDGLLRTIKAAYVIIGRLSKSKTALIGLSIISFWLFAAILQPLVRPYDPTSFHVADRFSPPSVKYLFGTDRYGRDIFSRVLAGSTTVFLVAATATALSLLLGIPAGLAAGYFGGMTDEIVMRFMDILMSFPALLLAMVILGIFGPSLVGVILAIGLVFSPRVSRVARSATLELRKQGFVEAGKVRGESSLYIMAMEIFPNTWAPLGVEAAIRFGYAIFTSASLGFLGLGVQPPTPDWGLMLTEAQGYLRIAPWMAVFPALAVASMVISVNFLSDGIRKLGSGDL